MTCMTYAKQVWTEELNNEWTTNGNSIYTANELADNWTGSSTTAISSSKVPFLVLYTGGSAGHTAVVTEYSNGKYHYKDYNGKKTNAEDDRWLDAQGIKGLFNTRTFKCILY